MKTNKTLKREDIKPGFLYKPGEVWIIVLNLYPCSVCFLDTMETVERLNIFALNDLVDNINSNKWEYYE